MNRLQGCIGAEVAYPGDGTDRLVIIGHPVKPYMFVQCWVNGCVGCKRWSGVRGVIPVLLYLIVLPFCWFVYAVTCLHVAIGGFVLELPLLMLEYPVFAVFRSSLLVFVSALLNPLLLCILLLSLFCLLFSCSILLLCSPLLLFCSPLSLLFSILFQFSAVLLSDL